MSEFSVDVQKYVRIFRSFNPVNVKHNKNLFIGYQLQISAL